jgi:hypothetical protein
MDGYGRRGKATPVKLCAWLQINLFRYVFETNLLLSHGMRIRLPSTLTVVRLILDTPGECWDGLLEQIAAAGRASLCDRRYLGKE